MWDEEADAPLRVRSEEYEDIVAHTLHRLGNTKSPSAIPHRLRMLHAVKNDPRKFEIYTGLTKELPAFLEKALAFATTTRAATIDPTPFAEFAVKNFGPEGGLMALELLGGLNEDMHKSPWSSFRRQDWKDTKQLAELFQSEDLKTQYGQFLDQRFIDYLAENFPSIDDINWRKFEGLTAEFFARLGYKVDIGAGRNDENVDCRAWKTAGDGPPTVIVQCKRQKEKVSKVVLKALYADVVHEKARSGLIVTTSDLSPGAKKTRTARGYPVGAADRQTLKGWLQRMRTPFSGVFLDE